MDDGGDAVGTVRGRDLRVVHLVVGREQLGGELVAAAVVHLLVEPADDGLVLGRHGLPSFNVPLEPTLLRRSKGGRPVVRLEELLDPSEESSSIGAVEGTMVPAHRQVADRMDHDLLEARQRLVTTGFSTMASVDKTPTCGWLMMAIVSTEPAEPLLEIVNVASPTSSGVSLRAPCTTGEVVDLTSDVADGLGVGISDDRHDQALVVEVDGDAQVDALMDEELLLDGIEALR